MKDYSEGYGEKRFERRDFQEKRIPAFQLNKFQSEFNLSFNKEMAKILADALLTNEDLMQNRGRNIPPPLFALLTKLEDMQKNKFYERERSSGDSRGYQNDQQDYFEDEYSERS